jgi:hypothetical protein
MDQSEFNDFLAQSLVVIRQTYCPDVWKLRTMHLDGKLLFNPVGILNSFVSIPQLKVYHEMMAAYAESHNISMMHGHLIIE